GIASAPPGGRRWTSTSGSPASPTSSSSTSTPPPSSAWRTTSGGPRRGAPADGCGSGPAAGRSARSRWSSPSPDRRRWPGRLPATLGLVLHEAVEALLEPLGEDRVLAEVVLQGQGLLELPAEPGVDAGPIVHHRPPRERRDLPGQRHCLGQGPAVVHHPGQE